MDELEIVKVEEEQPIEDKEKEDPAEEVVSTEEKAEEPSVPFDAAIDAVESVTDKIKDEIDLNKEEEEKIDQVGDEAADKLAEVADIDEEVWEGEEKEIPESETYYDDEIIEEEPAEESLTEASTAEKRAFAGGGEAEDDLIQGRAIARIKNPKDREAAIAAKKAGRDDVVKQFTGDRKEDQAVNAFDKKAQKMQDAGVRSIDEDLDDDLINAFLADDVEEPVVEELSPYEARKQRAVEMYNKFSTWANDAKNRTSCLCNVSVEQLNEWLGENND